MICKRSSITKITVWKLHIDTHINDVFERDNTKSDPVWLMKTNNVGNSAPEKIMLFTETLTGYWHSGNYRSTAHSRNIFGNKKHFNLPIKSAVSLLINHSVVVSPGHSFVWSGVDYCSPNLEPWEKRHFTNWLHTKKTKKVFFFPRNS